MRYAGNNLIRLTNSGVFHTHSLTSQSMTNNYGLPVFFYRAGLVAVRQPRTAAEDNTHNPSNVARARNLGMNLFNAYY